MVASLPRMTQSMAWLCLLPALACILFARPLACLKKRHWSPVAGSCRPADIVRISSNLVVHGAKIHRHPPRILRIPRAFDENALARIGAGPAIRAMTLGKSGVIGYADSRKLGGRSDFLACRAVLFAITSSQ